MELDVFKIDGSKSTHKVKLADDIFNIEPSDHAIYLSVKSYLANQRQGTHKTKERSEVRGGGKKPWKQKGRGGARAGTTRSPLWIGGGTTFGPRPRNYRQDLSKNVKRLARKSALSYKAKNNEIVVVEDFNYDEPKTKDVVEMLEALELNEKKVLLLTNGNLENVYKSARNIQKIQTLEADKASTYDILNNQVLLVQKGGIELIHKTFGKIVKSSKSKKVKAVS